MIVCNLSTLLRALLLLHLVLVTFDLVQLPELLPAIVPVEKGAGLRVNSFVKAAEDLGQDGLQDFAMRHEEHRTAALRAQGLRQGLHAARRVPGPRGHRNSCGVAAPCHSRAPVKRRGLGTRPGRP